MKARSQRPNSTLAYIFQILINDKNRLAKEYPSFAIESVTENSFKPMYIIELSWKRRKTWFPTYK